MRAIPPGGRLAVALAALAVTAAAAVVRISPPSPLPLSAPAAAFSAERALAVVREVAGDGLPRPVGSEADLGAAERLRARLEGRGYEAETHDEFACGPYGVCARVRNVIARLGPPGRKAVLLVAHHDSVGAGPGAADDAASVAATLEVARALSAGPPPPRPVIILLTDAEETGLVGATAFTEHHLWAREVGAVVNLEARGTAGASLMFETFGDRAWIASAVRSMPRPITSSLFSTIYRLIPNDTDLTVFARAGMPGLNLAFVQGAVRYHKPVDDVSHLDAASLQHQGENALALVRALAAADLEDGARRPTAFFDVMGAGVIAWPERASLPVAVIAAAIVAAAAVLLLHRDRVRPGALAFGLAAALGGPILGGALAIVSWLALKQGALPRLFVAHPGPWLAASWALGLAAALLVPAFAARRAGPAALLAAAGTLWAVLGLVLAGTLPGASHVAVVPALACGLAGLGCALAGRGAGALACPLVPAVVAAILLFPLALLLPTVLGVPAGAYVAAVVALVASFLAPLVAAIPGRGRFLPGGASLAVAFVLAGIAAAVPHATEDSPQVAAVVFHDEGGTARILVESDHDALPPSMRALAPFGPHRATSFAWQPYRPAFVAAAEPAHLEPPRLDVLSSREEDGLRRIRARIRSPRGAPVVMLVLPPGANVAAFAMDGVSVPSFAPKALRWTGGHPVYACTTLPPQGIEVEVALRGDAPVDATLADWTRGVPPAAAAVAAARPPWATTWQDGDVTVATTRVRL